MKVSVIITTYKRELSLLKRAFYSVCNQTYEDIEIIIVDDSPNDFVERAEIKNFFQQKFHHNVLYIQHEKNKGVCEARNSGLAVAKGDVIAYLDDDDEWKPEKIERQVKCMKRTSAAIVYLGKHIIQNDEDGKIKYVNHKIYEGNVLDQLMRENFIGSTSFPLINRKAILSVGKFDTNLRASEDYDMWIRIAKKYPISCVNEPLAIYHVHSSFSITKDASNSIQGIIKLLEKYKEYYNIHPNIYAKRVIALVPNYIKVGKREKAREILIKTIIKYPLNITCNTKWLLYYIIHR